MIRNAALEQAVLDDPTALAPRSVYADWLQREGSALGEWAALQAAMAERSDETAVRFAALAHLREHARELRRCSTRSSSTARCATPDRARSR